jgi:NAD(P)-dependent dehydrogenase (short-subunit alcohol dehydrogenase family)
MSSPRISGLLLSEWESVYFFRNSARNRDFQQAVKGGLEVLTRYMAKEFGERRIRANAISPGAIRTELGGGLSAEFETLLASQTALGRVGEPGDVGRVIANLLSDDCNWINAQTIEVAGGYLI